MCIGQVGDAFGLVLVGGERWERWTEREECSLEGIDRMSDLWSWGSQLNLTLIGRRELKWMIKSLFYVEYLV